MKISLGCGVETLIDDADAELILPYKWRLSDGYAFTYLALTKKTVKMHRLLLSPSDDVQVDHINRNRLDNRRCNLRLCDRFQNAWNMESHRPNKHGFRGIGCFYAKTGPRFYAQIVQFGQKHLGPRRDAAEIAARDYDELARALHGEFANLNFPVQS